MEVPTGSGDWCRYRFAVRDNISVYSDWIERLFLLRGISRSVPRCRFFARVFGYGLGNRILEPISAIGFLIGFVAFGLGFVSRLSNGPRDPWLVLLVVGAVLTILSLMYAGRFDLVKLLSINLCLVVIGGVLLSPWMYDWVFFLLLADALWMSVTNRSLPYKSLLSLAITCLGVAVLVRAFLGSGGKLVPHSAWEPVAITFVLQSPYASVFGVEAPAIFLSGPGSFAPIHLTEIGIGAAMYILGRRAMSLRLKT